MRGLQGRWGQSVQIVSIRFSLTGTRSWPALLKALDILFHWSAKGKRVKSDGFKERTLVQQRPHSQGENSRIWVSSFPSSHSLKIQRKSYCNYSSTNAAATASTRYPEASCLSWRTVSAGRQKSLEEANPEAAVRVPSTPVQNHARSKLEKRWDGLPHNHKTDP